MRPAGISKLLKLFSNVLYDRWLPINAIQQAFYLHTSIITLQAYMVYEHVAWVLQLLCMMSSFWHHYLPGNKNGAKADPQACVEYSRSQGAPIGCLGRP